MSRVARLLAMCAFVVLLRPVALNAQVSASELAAARQIIDDSGFTGTALVCHLEGNSCVAGHEDRIDRRLIPASTFKIFNSLVALETGVVADERAILPGDILDGGRGWRFIFFAFKRVFRDRPLGNGRGRSRQRERNRQEESDGRPMPDASGCH